MKTWQKVAVGCGGLGCAGLTGLFVLALLSGSLSEYEKRGREYREQKEKQAGAVEPSARDEGSTSPAVKPPQAVESPQVEESPQAVEQASPEPPPFVMEENGEPITLSRYVFRTHFDNEDSGSQEQQVFPEGDGVVGWVASRNIEGDGRRYTIYEYRVESPHVEFAVELRSGESLTLPGRSPRPGCYRYLGILEGRSVMENPVPIMLFRQETFEHPLCSPSDGE